MQNGTRFVPIVAIAVAVMGCSGAPRVVQNQDTDPAHSTMDGARHASNNPTHDGSKYQTGARETKAWLALAEADRQDRIRSARKRRVGDRVYVALSPTIIDRTDWLDGRMDDIEPAFRRTLEFEDAVSVVSESDLKLGSKVRSANVAAGLSPKCAPVADVNVIVKILGPTSNGTSGETIVLEARIVSNYLPNEYTVKERGPVDDAHSVAMRLASKVGYLLREPVCVALPVDRNL